MSVARTSSGVLPHVVEPSSAPRFSSQTFFIRSRFACLSSTAAMYALRPRGPATSSMIARVSAGSVMFVRTIGMAGPQCAAQCASACAEVSTPGRVVSELVTYPATRAKAAA